MATAARSAFVMTPVSLLERRRLSPLARIVWIRLMSHRNRRDDKCNPTHSKLAEELEVSVHRIKRAVRELRRAGLISGTNKCGRGNWYTLHEPTVCQCKGAPSASARMHRLPVQECAGTGASSLYEPDCIEPEEALLLLCVPSEAPTTAATPVECTQPETPTPPAPDSEAEDLAVELMGSHPWQGDLPRAVNEIRKVLSQQPGAADQIRRNHGAMRPHWELKYSQNPTAFRPPLWMWISEGHWRVEASSLPERKEVKRETWAEMRKREYAEHEERTYRNYAEIGAWEILREYGGDELVEVWRAKVETAA